MIGFLIGTMCLFGLLRVLRGGRCGQGGCGRGGGWGARSFGYDGGGWGGQHWDQGPGGYGPGGGFGEDPYRGGPPADDEGHGGGDGGGFGGRALLWEAFRRLDATPGQEKALRGIMDELRAKRSAIRDELVKARKDAAAAMRGEQWDENALGASVARIDASVDITRKALVEALAKTHEVLDERQRKILADLIEDGGLPFFSKDSTSKNPMHDGERHGGGSEHDGRGGRGGRGKRRRHGRGW